ncbi:hypothetical protein GCM10009715_12940 [Paeniglutamicibacter psychrophenolicus]|uniref:2'-5' RNA ligase family protein n=1 Tax=Paeniglutamicibacter psychrophenolicus TaxID=257454 RepID=A0ABS4W7S3_9MICC|nr:hypothetical protein [Paeniglutamicibacter psychrophenolicus]
MGACILVAFVVPVQAGLVFPRSGLPLHLTLVRFDSRETAEFVSTRLNGVLPARLGLGVHVTHAGERLRPGTRP